MMITKIQGKLLIKNKTQINIHLTPQINNSSSQLKKALTQLQIKKNRILFIQIRKV